VFGNGIRFVWHTGFSQHKQVPQGALVHAVQAGFIAVDEADGLGRGEIFKGGGEAADFVGAGLVIHVVLEHAGFDGPGAAHAPVGTDHLLDEAELDAIGGPEAVQVEVEEGFEAFAFLVLEDDAAGEQAMAQGVLSGTALAFGRDRAVGAGAIGAGGLDFAV
jgi:hypothetical protein